MPTAPNDIVRAVCGYSYGTGGRPMSNVLHYKDVGAGGVSDAALLTGMGIILEGVFGLIAQQQEQSFKYTTYTIQNITQGILIGTAAWPTLTQGVIVAAIDVSQAVSLLRALTIKTKVQGRLNLTGMPELAITNSLTSAAWNSAVLTAGANLLVNVVIAPSLFRYTVYNTEFGTDNFATSVALGLATRIMGRRKVP